MNVDLTSSQQFWTTLGYAQTGADRRLRYYMGRPRTLLIDLRKDPYSEYAQWDESTLERDWKRHYRRAGEYLGNVNHSTGGDICIPRLWEGVSVLLRYITEGWNLVLLCGCYNFCACHRATVASAFLDLLKQHKVYDTVSYIVEDTPLPGFMNCISLRQPWAEIIMRDALFRALSQISKDIDNHGWMTPYRGKLAIHASATFDTGIFKNKRIDPLRWKERFGVLSASLIPVHKDQYTRGAIIGIVDLVDIVTESKSLWYNPGQYGFVLENIQPIDPIPWKGGPRLFQVPARLVSRELSPTVYVDEIRNYETTLSYKEWCHMAVDGDIEHLHAFACMLDLKREWFQAKEKYPHYDLTPGKRSQAIDLGAVAVSSSVLLEKCWPDLVLGHGQEAES
jgi:hypothetical protein